jgi:hypothetical protein
VDTLDNWLEINGWPAVDLVKIDIEGSEAAALEGMRKTSHRNPRLQVIMELNRPAMERSGFTAGAVAHLLIELGFVRGFVIELGHREFSLTAGLPATQATYNLHLVKA